MMFCPKCKAEYRDGYYKCVVCNQDLVDELIPEEKKIVTDIFMIAPRWKRFLNYILDTFICLIFGMFITYIINVIDFLFRITGTGFSILSLVQGINEYIFSSIYILVYYFFTEVITGKTPAKYFTKTRVVMYNYQKPKFFSILLRSLCRFIPFDTFSFLLYPLPTGWHDKLSKTYVVNEDKN